MPDSHITDPHMQTCVHHTQKQCSLDRHEDKLQNLSYIFLMKLNEHKLITLTTVKVFKDSQLKISQSDYINFNNYGEKRDNTHIRFDRAHAPGPKLTSGLCLYIELVVAPATTQLN